jgi:hypothetical protein
MDIRMIDVECVMEEEAEDLVKKELISDVFMSLCIIVVGCDSLHFMFYL